VVIVELIMEDRGALQRTIGMKLAKVTRGPFEALINRKK
jgi:hypothetical protein